MSTIIQSIEQAQLRDVPVFKAGDTVRVHFKVIEGKRQRIQVFEGIVIKRQGSGVRETFTVRKQSFGVGVERTFPLHSPKIEKIEVAMIGDVNRAKLYYLRGSVGKKARISELRSRSGGYVTEPARVASTSPTRSSRTCGAESPREAGARVARTPSRPPTRDRTRCTEARSGGSSSGERVFICAAKRDDGRCDWYRATLKNAGWEVVLDGRAAVAFGRSERPWGRHEHVGTRSARRRSGSGDILGTMASPTGQRLLSFDRRLGVRFVAGADEAGRGSLAGPLVVAGVLLDYAALHDHRVRPLALLNDSKQVAPERARSSSGPCSRAPRRSPCASSQPGRSTGTASTAGTCAGCARCSAS